MREAVAKIELKSVVVAEPPEIHEVVFATRGFALTIVG